MPEVQAVVEQVPAQVVEQVPTQVVESPQDGDLDSLPEWARKSLTKANGEAAKYRNMAKELQPMADKGRELQQSQMSELERANTQLAEFQRSAEDASQAAVRYKAAATYGITSDYFDCLGTGTEEEVAERAERLGELIRAAAGSAAMREQMERGRSLTGMPMQKLKPGASPTDNQSEDEVLYNQLYGGK